MTMLDKFARIIDPGAFTESPMHGPKDSDREYAMARAREVMALVNESEANSPAYKQWAARGFPK